MRIHALALLAIAHAGCLDEEETQLSEPTEQAATIGVPLPGLVNAWFTVKSVGRKCMDFAPTASQRPGGDVYIWECNGTPAQNVHVVEIDAWTHDVKLMSSYGYCVGIRGGVATSGAALELQTCSDTSLTQRFAFDGDALYAGITRDLVVETQGGRGADRTPLVLGTQQTDPAEYFTFVSQSWNTPYPHTGFVTPQDEAQLRSLVNLGWGTVVVLNEATPITVTSPIALNTDGVTVRSFRRGEAPGARVDISGDWSELEFRGMFEVAAGTVRFTGFRCKGASRDKYLSLPHTSCITVFDAPQMPVGHRPLVDHVEASDFTWSAFVASGTDVRLECHETEYPRQPTARFVRNYLHHNQMNPSGYGVSAFQAFALIDGNTFTLNRHAIAGSSPAATGYQAIYNLVTSASEEYPGSFGTWYRNQDFDMHGSGDDARGGRAGDYADISYNTFLSIDGRKALYYRGTPCRQVQIHHNVNLNWYNNWDVGLVDPQTLVSIWANRRPDYPWHDLGVGDFDGDGYDDLFMGTGAGWYYASRGRNEWRFLNRASERASAVRFGDFDNDGRTDVLAYHGGYWDVSWGGSSPWEHINYLPVDFSDVRVGDFNGDRTADVFYTTGSEWRISWGGRSASTHFASAIHRSYQLLFADFNRDGKTDVFGIDGGYWKYVPGGSSTWVWLRPALPSNGVTDLRAADFDGDGYADIARGSSGTWQISKSGTGTFATLWSNVPDGFSWRTHLGRFLVGGRVDMLTWQGDTELRIISNGWSVLWPWTLVDVHAH
jgi:hypothetical protein